MQRRDLFVGVATLAASGMAGGAARAAAAVPARPRVSPSVFDFGAVGDGVSDDSAAFSAALRVAASEGRMVVVPGYEYAIAEPITWSSTDHVTRQWGLACQGATLRSKITTDREVMSLSCDHIVRYLVIGGGLTIKGNGAEGNGLRLFAPGGSHHFYNVSLQNIAIEGVGGDGLLFEGNVFESTVSSCFFQDCGQNGATFAHSQNGVVSAIDLIGCFFNQNGRFGMQCTNFDAKYGGTNDVRVFGGYCRENQKFGFVFHNGTAPGASIQQVGFENNYLSKEPGDRDGAHVYARVRLAMRDCAGYNEFGGATFLLRGQFTDLTVLDGCSQDSGGAMRATGNSRLVRVGGAHGHVLLRGCSGGVDVDAGTSCTWEARNSTGPCPLGNLDMRGSLGNV